MRGTGDTEAAGETHTGKPGDRAGGAGQRPTVNPEQQGKAPTFHSGPS